MKPRAGRDPYDGGGVYKNLNNKTIKPGGPHYPRHVDRKPCGGNREPDAGGL